MLNSDMQNPPTHSTEQKNSFPINKKAVSI